MRRIGLFYGPDNSLRDPIIHGVIDHLRASGRWLVWQHWGPVVDQVELAGFLAWKPDGVLLFAAGGELLDRLGLAWLRASGGSDGALRFDEERIGAQAAEHLLATGLRRLAVSALPGEPWASRRRGFVAHATLRGATVDQVAPGERGFLGLRAWIAKAFEPVGLFALNDYFAFQLVGACIEAGIAVPQRVAIIGADDLPELCELSPVPLSSVRIPHRQMARRAAELLDRRLDGARHPAAREILQPLGVSERLSTSIERIVDVEVATVLRLSRDQVDEGLKVADIVAACGVSRRALEVRVRAALGTTILGEIHRARIRAAERLLAETDLSVTVIAGRTGWGDLSSFNSAFRKATGLAPSAWRRARGAST